MHSTGFFLGEWDIATGKEQKMFSSLEKKCAKCKEAIAESFINDLAV